MFFFFGPYSWNAIQHPCAIVPFVRMCVNLRIFLLDKQEEFYWTSLCHSLVPHLFMATFPHDFFSPDFKIFIQFIFRFKPLPDKGFSMIKVFLRLTPMRTNGTIAQRLPDKIFYCLSHKNEAIFNVQPYFSKRLKLNQACYFAFRIASYITS